MCSDLLGSYPIYGGGKGELFFSNSPELIRRLVGTGGSSCSRVSVLAGFFAGGAAIDGAPRWEEVDRLPAGVQRFAAADGARRGPSTIDWLPLLDDRFDVEIASRRLVAVVRALSDWPGRPAHVSLSGGRDSRLVLAAAVAAGIDVSPRTMAIPGAPGYPETKDIVLARVLCEAAGVGLEIVEPVMSVPPARSEPSSACSRRERSRSNWPSRQRSHAPSAPGRSRSRSCRQAIAGRSPGPTTASPREKTPPL